MGFKYTEGLLLSDLLCLYKETNDEKCLKEIKKRLHFCEFTNDEIEQFLRIEGEVIDSHIEKYNGPLSKKYWIIGQKNKQKIFDTPNKYMYNPEENSQTLLLSELLAVLDEAIFLSLSNEINKYKAKDEIISLAKENKNNWLYIDFYSRVEYMLRCANSVMIHSDSTLFPDKIRYLYDNETQILLFRWPSDFYNYENLFIPYTEQYFDLNGVK